MARKMSRKERGSLNLLKIKWFFLEAWCKIFLSRSCRNIRLERVVNNLEKLKFGFWSTSEKHVDQAHHFKKKIKFSKAEKQSSLTVCLLLDFNKILGTVGAWCCVLEQLQCWSQCELAVPPEGVAEHGQTQSKPVVLGKAKVNEAVN